jgi:predicted nucleotidyltransferase
MTERAVPPLLGRVVQRYIRAFAPERIVLFGSWAKGTNHLRSDVDLLVVAEMEGDPAIYLSRAKQLAADCFPPLDIVFVSPDEMEPPELDRNPFLLSVLRSGIVLYSRHPNP